MNAQQKVPGQRRIPRIAIVAIVVALLVVRENGVFAFSLNSSSSRSWSGIFSFDSKERPVDHALFGDPVAKMAGPDSTTIRYFESRENPWSRWIPLYKFGTTKITRHFDVERNGSSILTGTYTWSADVTVFGIISARQYAELASPGDRFLNDVKGQIEKKTVAKN